MHRRAPSVHIPEIQKREIANITEPQTPPQTPQPPEYEILETRIRRATHFSCMPGGGGGTAPGCPHRPRGPAPRPRSAAAPAPPGGSAAAAPAPGGAAPPPPGPAPPPPAAAATPGAGRTVPRPAGKLPPQVSMRRLSGSV